jgi:hypothetical protein
MTYGHGGKREGAGRKRGSPNVRKVNEIAKEAIERGETPVQYFLSITKDVNEPTDRRDWATTQAVRGVAVRD